MSSFLTIWKDGQVYGAVRLQNRLDALIGSTPVHVIQGRVTDVKTGAASKEDATILFALEGGEIVELYLEGQALTEMRLGLHSWSD